MFFPPANQFVVTLLEETESRIIPIWIGIPEGNALHLKIKKKKTPRPLTHDLLMTIMDTFSVSVKKVIISDLKSNTYYARLEVQSNGKTLEIDTRPSDAFVLSVTKKIPIFIEESVLSHCPHIPKPISQEDIDKFNNEVSTLSPEEFFKKLEEGK